MEPDPFGPTLATWTTTNVTHARIGTGSIETRQASVPLSAGANPVFRLKVREVRRGETRR